MSTTKQVAKEIEKSTGNTRKLELGDQVLHTVSRIRGRVEEIAEVGSETVISVRTTTGRLLTKLNRREFVLDSRMVGGVTWDPTTPSPFEEPMPTLEGPISDGSILDELV